MSYMYIGKISNVNERSKTKKKQFYKTSTNKCFQRYLDSFCSYFLFLFFLQCHATGRLDSKSTENFFQTAAHTSSTQATETNMINKRHIQHHPLFLSTQHIHSMDSILFVRLFLRFCVTQRHRRRNESELKI